MQRVRGAIGVSLRSIVFPLLFILLAGATLMYLTNRHAANTYFAQFASPTGNNVQGIWIGVLDIYDYPVAPNLFTGSEPKSFSKPHIAKQAAILIEVRLTDAFMEDYEGDGSFYIQGGLPPRKLTHMHFDLTRGVLRGSTFTDDKAGDRDGFFGSHTTEGTVQDGTMQIRKLDFGDYGYRGTLRHGTMRDFLQLCQTLPLEAPAGRRL